MWGFKSPLSHQAMDGPERRYDRQMRVPQVGEAGQQRLRESTAALIGLGALGGVAADLLARAGVGRLLLIDRDIVEWSNLQRQILFDESDAKAGQPKAIAAQQRLQAVNSEIELVPLLHDLDAGNHRKLLQGASVLVDGTDNFATRYLLNDYAVSEQIPYVYAGVVATYGMIGAIVPGGACLRCTYPEPPSAADTPTCRSAGVLGPAVSVVAGWAAAYALRCLLGEAPQAGFRYLDLWSDEERRLRSAKDPDCPCCAAGDFAWADGRRGQKKAEPVCGGGAVQLPAEGAAPQLEVLAQRLQGSVEDLLATPTFLRFRVRDCEVFYFADGRALVRGTEEPAQARSMLAETIGA